MLQATKAGDATGECLLYVTERPLGSHLWRSVCSVTPWAQWCPVGARDRGVSFSASRNASRPCRSVSVPTRRSPRLWASQRRSCAKMWLLTRSWADRTSWHVPLFKQELWLLQAVYVRHARGAVKN